MPHLRRVLTSTWKPNRQLVSETPKIKIKKEGEKIHFIMAVYKSDERLHDACISRVSQCYEDKNGGLDFPCLLTLVLPHALAPLLGQIEVPHHRVPLDELGFGGEIGIVVLLFEGHGDHA